MTSGDTASTSQIRIYELIHWNSLYEFVPHLRGGGVDENERSY